MTQLSLFDAPVNSNVPAVPAAEQPPAPVRRISATNEDGPQRLGNLAHLVLARYDMMNRRKAARRRAHSTVRDIA